MSVNVLISFFGAVYSAVLAWYVWSRDKHSFVHRTFGAGMLILAGEAAVGGLSLLAASPEDALYWQRWRFALESLLPGVWLLFSMSYGREDYGPFLAQWKWVALPFFLLPPLAVLFQEAFFAGAPVRAPSGSWLFRLGWTGYVFHLLFVAGAAFILMNLERALRRSSGHSRWQIKFIVLGIGSLFAVRIYTCSQVILYRTLNAGLEILDFAALIVAGLLVIRSLMRNRLLNVRLYLSQSLLYNSVALLLVGVYFISVGLIAKIALYFDSSQGLTFRAFLIFLIFLGLPILLLSDRLRIRIKRFVSHHLQRPFYDYRKEWSNFTRRTSSITEMSDLCREVCRLASKTFETLSVTIWLWDEPGQKAVLGGSTVLTAADVQKVGLLERGAGEFMERFRKGGWPENFDYSGKAPEGMENQWPGKEFLRAARARYAFPLTAGDKFLGLMTLGERTSREPFNMEDFELLKTMADQSASGLLNLQLLGRLRETKEMEAFQTMSAFFVHDLKNLASRLSLTMQNLPVHFDNPEFRRDALRTISQSLEKINALCGRLSSLSQKADLKPEAVDLNELVTDTLSSLNGSLRGSFSRDLQPLPALSIDREQFQTVLVNLLINADEAAGKGGEVCVTTRTRGTLAELSVRDNGCGMTKDFIENGLFRPFRTTKKQGMGIGLFQSKMIVEAHGGRIDVASEENKGSTFFVLLPMPGR